MLLLTSLAFGGSEAVESYAHLDQVEEEILRHRAAALLQIPREKRVPLLVQELKRLVTQRRRQLGAAEPARLATLLKDERPAMVEVVLGALPAEMADAVRAELGLASRGASAREVKPEVLSLVRWKLDEALRATAPKVGGFRFTDLMMMPSREVLAVADRMGARVLATTVAGLEEADRTAFLAGLAPDQRALAVRAAEAGAARRLTGRDARLVLEMHGALENPSLGLRSAGVQRIVRACLAQGADFAQRFCERHQGDLGQLLMRWLPEEKGKPVKGDGGRLDIVEQLERLAQRGILDRPMRLPPPVRAPAPVSPPQPAPQSPPRQASPRPIPTTSTPGSKVLVPPPQRRASTGQMPAHPAAGRPSAPSVPAAAGRPRRDPIAEREARRAGAGRGPEAGEEAAEGAPDAPERGQRIMRDGRPLERGPKAASGPAPRRPTSPVQQLPRRREGAAPAGGSASTPHRSPVVKGPGRGPTGGSR